MIVALSALLISVVTTIIGIYSTMTARTQGHKFGQGLNELYRGFLIKPEQESLSYGLMNNGIGPAIIKYAKVTFNNEPVKKWSDFLVNSSLVQSHMSTRILPSQANVHAVTLKDKD